MFASVSLPKIQSWISVCYSLNGLQHAEIKEMATCCLA